MRLNKPILIFHLLALVLSMSLLFSPVVYSLDKSFVIVAHPSVTEKKLSRVDLRRIYLGKLKRWEDGKKIKAAQLKDKTIAENFSYYVFGKPHSKFKLYWRRVVAAGMGIPPKHFEKSTALIEYVKKTEGAIGFVSREANTAGLKQLQINK